LTSPASHLKLFLAESGSGAAGSAGFGSFQRARDVFNFIAGGGQLGFSLESMLHGATVGAAFLLPNLIRALSQRSEIVSIHV